MNLLSINFLLFLLVSLVLYYLVPKKLQWLVLLMASYFFYALSGIKYFAYLIVTTLSTYLIAKKIQSINDDIKELDRKTDSNLINKYKKKASTFLFIAVSLNFVILAFLKYYSYVFNLLQPYIPSFSNEWNLLLPLGISFYTFQSIAYVIDVKRGKVQASNHLGKYALFVSYFPQIIQGPISRFDDLYPQFSKQVSLKYENIVYGMELISLGIFKKIVIADRASVLVNQVFNNYQDYQGLTLLIASLFYSIQIYGDFSGGIDMIRGVSEMFGIELLDNFNQPYFAKTVSEFWKRWHITLGSWMRDYVFYPIALSKRFGKMGRNMRKKFGNHIGKQVPLAIASFIVFILVGAWHGSSLKFIAYGLYNGVFVLSESLLEPIYVKMRVFFGVKDVNQGSFKLFQMLRTTFIVVIGRFFSRGKSLKISLRMIKSSLSVWNPWVLFDGSLYELGLKKEEFTVLFIALLLLLLISYVREKGISVREWLHNQPLIFRWSILIVWILFISIYGYYGPNVSASDFIYQGF